MENKYSKGWSTEKAWCSIHIQRAMHTGRQTIATSCRLRNSIFFSQISPVLFVIFPVVHQPSNWGTCDVEDSRRSECSRREGGATGLMEKGVVGVVVVVVSFELMGVATLLGGVSSGEAGVAKV